MGSDSSDFGDREISILIDFEEFGIFDESTIKGFCCFGNGN
jgi:hypothetical protein